MKNKVLDDIDKWKKLSNKIAEQFLYDYFDDLDPYYWWVSDEEGGILCYGDYFISFDTILTCYKLDITFEQFINWYDFCLSNQSVNISLAKFILSPKERKEAEEKHLTELKERVELAEKEFKKALDEYEHNT
jgi:hypothetical protein